MATNKSTSETNADKLRELLSDSYRNKTSVDYIKDKYNFDENPQVDDLIHLIQMVENVNHHLLAENTFLKEEAVKSKSNILKLIEENSALHTELKNATVIDILNEFENNNSNHSNANFNSNQQYTTGANPNVQNQLKTKEKELHQSQLLIKELEKKLANELNRQCRSKKSNNASGSGIGIGDTFENIEFDLNCCTKCSEELELKIRQIENLRNQIEQVTKSKDFLKSKLGNLEIKEADYISQIKKYVDLVKHLEMEKNQSETEKEQYRIDKLGADKKLEEIMREFNEKILKEKEIVITNVDCELKNLTQQNHLLEERLFKQENQIDRLTRDKVSLTSEVESYKKKCNSIDFDTHQMADKLRNKYMDIMKERDLLLNELKRVRHDYDLYVKQNDQDKFVLRNELNSNRTRLLDVEKDLLLSREQCIQLTEQINKLESNIILLKYSNESAEKSRNEGNNDIVTKYEKREGQLVAGIEALQVRYCVTIKDLEDLVEKQKKLLDKLRVECRTLNDQLEVLALKYKNDTNYLGNQCEELTVRLSKYEERVKEFEEQNEKHNEIHDKMKLRLKELTLKIEEQRSELQKVQTNETLMKTTNIQLMQDLNAVKQPQFAMNNIPTRNNGNNFQENIVNSYMNIDRTKNLNALSKNLNSNNFHVNESTLNTVRSMIEKSMYSVKS